MPWNNWHSMLAPIDPGVVPEAVAKEALFQNRVSGDQLESSVRSGLQTYHNGRIRGLVQRQATTSTRSAAGSARPRGWTITCGSPRRAANTSRAGR